MGYVEITALEDGESVGLFAIPALFITLRETLEAAIVISVLLGLLSRVGMPHLKKWVWIGVGSAFFLTIAGAILVILLINYAKDTLFEGNKEELAEGSISIIAAVLIAIVALSIGDIHAIQDRIEAKILAKVQAKQAEEERLSREGNSPVDAKLKDVESADSNDAGLLTDIDTATVSPALEKTDSVAGPEKTSSLGNSSGSGSETTDGIVMAEEVAIEKITSGNGLVLDELDHEDRADIEREVTAELMFFLSFTAVIREGLETVVFFVGITATYPPESLPIPALLGIIIGGACGILLYKGGGKLTIKLFFRATMILLVFIGAGVWSNGWRELLEAGVLGTWDPEEDRKPIHRIVYDVTGCCGLDNQFWLLMRVLFGWNPEPTGMDFLMYFGYHLVMWSLIYIKFKRAKNNQPGFKKLIKYYICRRGEKP
mmetsp:Transcript_8812/g.17433  ORF Transcript_8812/g.17433 Transcript_8812/m.17433 type:complete len:429 (-) Transcript_8812:489-1775(-)|eukprot:CAMPEP_0171489436 /NCGR_PEP_ID=MMETSP0958-20121227/2756_1 /TAXON_ID=87120 /ORGANISM="Aurantiochytrium limacinum, Strain ATCCMYA-1381" /LENGTH=428 /DNA_ID=CAMNT_0012022649 /DNA_START=194 /DNA_END=1480 /DNA_ORIENTATION=-